MANRKPAVFVDRDGTIITERGYLTDVRRMKLYPSSAKGLRVLQNAGFKIVIITNQSAVGRGLLTLETLASIHNELKRRLRAKGVTVSGIYFCPHLPDAGCRCRKPQPFLLQKAAYEHNIDLKASYTIGDQDRDVELARGVGAKGVLVLTGAGFSLRKKVGPRAVKVARNLLGAARWIARQSR